MSDGGVQLYSGPGGPSWTVTNAMQTTDRAPNGTYVKGWEVTYQIATGHTGTVFVPSEQFSPDMVRQAVNDAAAKLYSVVNLSSQ